MVARFRGITTRQAALFEGPAGWGEFSPFVEYADAEAASWLAAGLEAAWKGLPRGRREAIDVNATIPAVDAQQVPELAARYPGCQTFKVKVAEPGQSLRADVARVEAVRAAVPGARIRVDANGGWTVEQALAAAAELGPLDYMEQPCASVEELAQLRGLLQRRGHFVRVAADESIRRAADPYRVAQLHAADVAVVKVAPLGGVRRVLALAQDLRAQHMDITVASALDTAVGLSAGLAAVSALPTITDDDGSDVPPAAAGLATQQLFAADVAAPRPLIDGRLPTAPAVPEPERLADLAADAATADWWRGRIERCWQVLAE